MFIAIPTVSVILPNYNHSLFLQKRIDSILSQSFQDFELIILDDCSTDSSRDLLTQYAGDAKVSHVIFNETNSGSTFTQWQRGFDLARGEYIWIAESDDYADVTFLEKLVRELQKDPMSTIAFSKSNIIDAQGNLLDEDWDRIRTKDSVAVSYFEGEEFVKARMLFNNSIYNGSMVVFRKSAMAKVNMEYANLIYSGDWMFWIDICVQGNVIRYNEKLNNFRQHLQKVSPKAERKGIRFIEGKIVLKYVFEKLALTDIQQRVVGGRLIKSLVTDKKIESKELKQEIYKQVVDYFQLKKSSILIYELDKLFDFSHLGIQKNRYL